MGLMLVPSVYAYGPDSNYKDLNPAQTPWITRREDTESIVDVTPKYSVITSDPIVFDCEYKVNILTSGMINKVWIQINVPYDDVVNFESSPKYIYDKDNNPVGEIFPDKFWSNEIDDGWTYKGFVDADTYFDEGDSFFVRFTIEYAPLSRNAHCLFQYRYAAYGSSNYFMELHYMYVGIGDEYNTTPNFPSWVRYEPGVIPVFMVPELPLGTITALVTMASVVLLRRKK